MKCKPVLRVRILKCSHIDAIASRYGEGLLHTQVKGMGKKPKRHCGTDIHESYIRAAIVNNNSWVNDEDIVAEANFVNDVEGHLQCVKWQREHGCRRNGMESTGDYWKAFAYTLIEYGFEVRVGNGEKMKNVCSPKTDKLDARWIARLMRDGYIPKSNILSKEHDDFRTTVRTRNRLVKDRTASKNRVSALVAKMGIRLKCSDKFGKFGRKVLKAIAKGDDLDSIFKSKQGAKLGYTKDEFIATLETHITQPMRNQLDIWLNRIDELDAAIKKVEELIAKMIHDDGTLLELIEIVRSIPGFRDIASPIVLAEIGDISAFPQCKHFCSYSGLVPMVYQSGERVKDGEKILWINTGRLRPASNKRLKWIFIEAANVIAKQKLTPLNSPLLSFYRRIYNRHSGRYQRSKAICALAHKLAKIVWTLLTKGEMYRGVDGSEKSIEPFKNPKADPVCTEAPILTRVHDMLSISKMVRDRILPHELENHPPPPPEKKKLTLWDIPA